MYIERTHRLVLAATLLLGSTALIAQDPNFPTQPQSMPTNSASASTNRQRDPESTPTPGLTGQQMLDKKFLRDFAQGGLAEVKLGQLATTRASSDDVKTFGAKIMADHSQMTKDLSPLADEMGVRLPKDLSKSDQAEYEKLSKLSGDEFDREYLTVMLEDHRKDLHALRQESMATQDTALHAVVDKSFLQVREHMGMAVKLAREKGIAVPAPPQSAGAMAHPPNQ